MNKIVKRLFKIISGSIIGILLLAEIFIMNIEKVANFIFNPSLPQGEPELYLIPDTFHGIVEIKFNRAEGMKKNYENGWRILNIPPTGELTTQFDEQLGKDIKLQFFYVNSKGERKKLDRFDTDEFKDINRKNTNGLLREQIAVFNFASIGSNGSISFYVDSYAGLHNPPHESKTEIKK